MSLEYIITQSDGAIFNNAAQTFNHNFYWNCLSPVATTSSDALLRKITEVFGSIEKFKDSPNVSFYAHDANDLASLNLGEFDLIISVGTLQSSNLKFNSILASLVQNQLKRTGAMILGFPNCRWIDGEMVYGARVKNYSFSEMGLLYKDVVFAKKYLQQKKFRVTITGKEYIFITATSIKKA